MKNNGFTLIELLVSISIIAIISAIASMSFSVAQKKARDTRRMQDLSAVQKAAEQYYTFSKYTYPTSETGPWDTTVAPSQRVLDVFPTDPKTGSGGAVVNPYVKSLTVDGYCVCAVLEYAVGNSSTTDCSTFVASGGSNFCVKNQQ